MLTIRHRSAGACLDVDRNGKQNKVFRVLPTLLLKANDSAGVNFQAESRRTIEETERIFVSKQYCVVVSITYVKYYYPCLGLSP